MAGGSARGARGARGGARGARAALALALAALALAGPRGGAAAAGPPPRPGGGGLLGRGGGFEAAGFAGLHYTAGQGPAREGGVSLQPWGSGAGSGAGAGFGLPCSDDPFEEVAVGEHTAVRLYRCRAPAGGGPPPPEQAPPEAQAPPGTECPSALSGAALWAVRTAVCFLAAWARSRLQAGVTAARGAAPRLA